MDATKTTTKIETISRFICFTFVLHQAQNIQENYEILQHIMTFHRI